MRFSGVEIEDKELLAPWLSLSRDSKNPTTIYDEPELIFHELKHQR